MKDAVVLKVENLTITFPSENKQSTGKQVVKGISFELHRGEIIGIVGESGSGKSLTSLGIMGLIPPTGKIAKDSQIKCQFLPEELQQLGLDKQQLDNEGMVNLLSLNERQKTHYRGGKIAMIFQEPMSAFNPVYTIGFQLIEAIKLHQNVTPEQAKAQAIDRLREVTLLSSPEQFEQQRLPFKNYTDYLSQTGEKLLKKYPHELSGGQLQRVMIAMAISCDPTILIADEPTTALDVTTQKGILELLKNLCKIRRDMAMIFISHDLGVINQIADAVLVMYKGEKREFKRINPNHQQGIFTEPPKDPYTKGLLACRPKLSQKLTLLPTVSDFMSVREDEQGNILEITSKQPQMSQYRLIPLEEERQNITHLIDKAVPILSVQNLSVIYRKSGLFSTTESKVAVDHISFELYEGEILGIVGESGSGKSTLSRAILRLIPATGQIKFQGINLSNPSLDAQKLRELRRKIQIVFQNPYNSLNPRMTVGEAICEPMMIHNLYRKDRKGEALRLLADVRLDESYFNRYPHELSGGQRQRVCIARALALDPCLLICDESVSALDVSIQAEVLNLLKKLQKEKNLTYIFISHDLSVVRFISDRIMVMKDGKTPENPPIKPSYQIIHDRESNSDYTNRLIESIPLFQEDLLSHQ